MTEVASSPDTTRQTPISPAIDTTKPAEKPVNLVAVSSRYFKRASVDCPASVHAQAARITQLARTEKQDLLGIESALLADEAAIIDIQQAGNRAHDASDNLNAPQLQTLDIIKSTIKSDFYIARGYENLSDAQLEELTGTLYQESKQSHDPDNFMAEKVWFMLAAAKKSKT